MKTTDLQTITQEISDTDTSELNGKYLTYWIDKQSFGVPIAHVVQIVGMQAVTEIPAFPHYAKGIINLRGSIIPLIDIRLRLGKPEAEYDERTCIIVTNINEHSVGFIVDEVDSVIAIPEDSILPPPQLSGGTDSFITGVGKLEDRLTLLMDTHKIVGANELDLLTLQI